MFYIDNLILNGFRNYRHQILEFSPSLNIIEGDNAQGKTNLLEAIYYLSVNRSFRTNSDQEMVMKGDNYFRLKGNFIKSSFRNEIEIHYSQRNPLKILLNKEPVNRYDYLQMFPVIIFSPDDLLLIKEGPSIRRRFLNLEASRLNRFYFDELRSYQRILRQRNFLLKEKSNYGRLKELLEPWTRALVETGSNIIHTRINLVKNIEIEAQAFFNALTDNREILTLEYVCSFKAAEEVDDTQKLFYESLLAKKDYELKRGSTAVGPHLDDLKIIINGFDTRKYSSQGQKRTAALALKMAEINLLKLQDKSRPIILLDDVFSEFDRERKKYLLSFINKNSGQCFISTADSIDSITDKFYNDHKVICINNGRVTGEKSRSGS